MRTVDVQDASCTVAFQDDAPLGTVILQDDIILDPGTSLTVESVGSYSDMPELLWGIHMQDSSSDASSSDDSSSITSVSNNDPITDTSQEPPKTGGVIVKTFGFVCVMCLTSCELTSIVYLNLLEAVLRKFTT